MSLRHATAARPAHQRWGPRWLAPSGVAAASLGIGVGLGALGGAFGPLVMVAIPLVLGTTLALVGRPQLALPLIFLAFPAGFVSLPTDTLGLQAAEITVLLVIGLTLLRRLGSGSVPLPWAPQMWWALAFVAWAVAVTPGALDREAALKQDAQLVGGLLLVLAVLASYRSVSDARGALATLLVVGSGIAAYGLGGVSELRAQFGGGVGLNRASGVFSHPNDLGAFAATVLLLGVGWTLGARSHLERLLGVAASAVTFLVLAVTLSRGAWMGAALSGLLLLAILPRARRALLTIGVPILVTGTILVVRFGPPDTPQFEAVAERFASITRPTSSPYDDRPAIYREAIRQIRERPLTGNGPGSFPFASARATSFARTVNGAVHAHNVLLTVAAETGLPNVAVLIAFTGAIGVAVFRAGRRLRDRTDRSLVAGIGAALFVQVGQGVVDFNLRNPVLFILVAALVGLVLVARREALEHPQLEATEEAG